MQPRITYRIDNYITLEQCRDLMNMGMCAYIDEGKYITLQVEKIQKNSRSAKRHA